MIEYREILRLDSLGYSRRRISSMVNSSHHTVEDTIKAMPTPASRYRNPAIMVGGYILQKQFGKGRVQRIERRGEDREKDRFPHGDNLTSRMWRWRR